jgi:hypothetical protein
MSRASYCREQARLCRDAAAQVGLTKDAARLREIATTYEAEAEALGEEMEQSASQSDTQRRDQPQD